MSLRVISAGFELLDAIRLNSCIPPSLIYDHCTELSSVPPQATNEVPLNSETGALVRYQPLVNWSSPPIICSDACIPSLSPMLFFSRNEFIPGDIHSDIIGRETFSFDSRTGAVVLYVPPPCFIIQEPSTRSRVLPLVPDVSNLVPLATGLLVLLPSLPHFPTAPNSCSSPTSSLILMLASKQKHVKVSGLESKALILYRPLAWSAPVPTRSPPAGADMSRPSTDLVLMLARKVTEQMRLAKLTVPVVEVQPSVVPDTPVETPKRRSRPVPQAQFLRNLVITQHKSNNKPSPSRTPGSALPSPQPTPKRGEHVVERPALSGGVLLGVPGRSRPPPSAGQKKENTVAKTPVTPAPRQGHNKRRRPGPDIALTSSRK